MCHFVKTGRGAMKNWIGRMLGGAGKDAAAAAPAGTALAFGDDQAMAAEVHATYYRWLTASSGGTASSGQEAQILREVNSLAADPVCASGLVPRIPELISQLLTALSDENISTGALSAQVGRDLVLVAEVMPATGIFRPTSSRRSRRRARPMPRIWPRHWRRAIASPSCACCSMRT